jgi:putative MATE family efflux protein
MTHAMLTRPVWWLVLRQGLPLAVGMACHALFNLVDLWMVGDFGADAVAGVHCATTMNFLPMIVGNGLSVAAMTLIAQDLGASRSAAARDRSNHANLHMTLFGALLSVLGALLAAPAVDLQGASGAARAHGIDYMIVTSLCTVTMFGLMQATASLRAVGEVAMPFALLLGANVLNIALNFPCMYGWERFGLPALGPVGAAWASGLSRLLAWGVALGWLRRAGHPLRLGWSPASGRSLRVQLWRLAWPQSLQMLARVTPVILLTRFAGELAGNPAITALGVTTRLDTLVLFGSIGFASAATTVSGHNIGAGDSARARAAGWHAGWQSMVFAALLVGALAWAARELLGWFVASPSLQVEAVAVSYLRMAAWAHPLAAFCIAGAGALQGAGRVVPPMVIDVAGLLLVFLPAGAALCSFTPSFGVHGLWWVVLATQLVLLIAYVAYLRLWPWAERVRLPG